MRWRRGKESDELLEEVKHCSQNLQGALLAADSWVSEGTRDLCWEAMLQETRSPEGVQEKLRRIEAAAGALKAEKAARDRKEYERAEAEVERLREVVAEVRSGALVGDEALDSVRRVLKRSAEVATVPGAFEQGAALNREVRAVWCEVGRSGENLAALHRHVARSAAGMNEADAELDARMGGVLLVRADGVDPLEAPMELANGLVLTPGALVGTLMGLRDAVEVTSLSAAQLETLVVLAAEDRASSLHALRESALALEG